MPDQQSPDVVSRDEWIKARKDLLHQEKEVQKALDKVAQDRRRLPWVKVEKGYSFESVETGEKKGLKELFKGRSQLLVYHFMFGEEWTEGCPSCSLLADHLTEDLRTHLAARDVTVAVVSKAPAKPLKAYKERMGWTFDWYSANSTDFNEDYRVTFSQEDVDKKKVYYNYQIQDQFNDTEAPGCSVFKKDEEHGTVYHTYSTYSRGLERIMGIYGFLDLVPKGRDEANLSWPMAWVKRHDKYDG